MRFGSSATARVRRRKEERRLTIARKMKNLVIKLSSTPVFLGIPSNLASTAK